MLTCPHVRDLLADSPHSGDPAVVAHLTRCAACRAVAAEWRAVDAAVRARPTPDSALAARDAFLDRLSPATPRRREPVRRTRWVEWAVAASLFLGIAAATFFLSEPREVAAKPKLVEELVEWNLTLAEAETRETRETLVRDRLPAFRLAVRDTDLSARDRQLANRLIAEGEWQVSNDDPLGAAERLHGLADEMLTLADEAEPASERSAVFVKLTGQLATRGVLKTAARQAALKEKRDEARLARLLAAQEKQAAKMAAVAERQAAAQLLKKAKGKKGK